MYEPLTPELIARMRDAPGAKVILYDREGNPVEALTTRASATDLTAIIPWDAGNDTSHAVEIGLSTLVQIVAREGFATSTLSLETTVDPDQYPYRRRRRMTGEVYAWGSIEAGDSISLDTTQAWGMRWIRFRSSVPQAQATSIGVQYVPGVI